MQPMLALLLSLSLPLPAGAADEKPLKAASPTISLMEVKSSSATTPGAAVKLAKGQLYVVRCTKKCDILEFPKKSVSYEEKKGPRDITAIFPGGTGDFEDRSFAEPFLYILKATSTGPATVTVIPTEYKDRSEWVELLLDCNNGARPPPVPTPDPVDPDVKPFTGTWQIVIVEETEEATAARGQFFSNKELWDYITSKCVKKPRIVDQNVVSSNGKPPTDLAPYLSRAKGKKLPQVYVVGSDGTVLIEGALPESPAEFLKQLKGIK